MTYAIVACARNEGPFLIEWIAHHLAIGFDKIFVATNDCDDGTDDLLDLLSRDWPVYRIENSQPTPGDTFQRSGVKRCLSHPAMTQHDWVLHIDLDEFLNIRTEDPQVGHFMQGFQDAHAVMFGWRVFGSGDRAFWDGGSVLDSFVTCQATRQNLHQKTMFRASAFGDAAPHCPKAPNVAAQTLRVVNTNGVLLNADVCYFRKGTVLRVAEDHLVWDGAYINHYMHKSRDLTDLSRKLRGDANGRRGAHAKRTTGTIEYDKFDCNDAVDTSIQACRATRVRLLNELLATRGVLAAHYRAQHWFQEQLLSLRIQKDKRNEAESRNNGALSDASEARLVS